MSELNNLSGYILICKADIGLSSNDLIESPANIAAIRKNPTGISLLNLFKKGPCKAVKKIGININKDTNANEFFKDHEENKADSNGTNNNQTDNNSPQDTQNNDDSNKNSTDNNSLHIDCSNSILEANLLLHNIFEKSKKNKNKNRNKNKNKVPGASNDQSPTGEPSAEQSTDQNNPPTDQSPAEEQPNKILKNDRFIYGGSLVIRLLLPNEGYTDWFVYLDKRVINNNITTITSLLKSGKFKQAVDEAHKVGSDGLIPIGFKTYVYKDRDINDGLPYIGNSIFALDKIIEAGDDTNNDDASAISLAIRPINMKTGEKASKDLDICANYIVNSAEKLGKLPDFSGHAILKAAIGKIADFFKGQLKLDKPNIERERVSSIYVDFISLRNWIKKRLTTTIQLEGDNDKVETVSVIEYDKETSTAINVDYYKKVQNAKVWITY